MTASKTVKKLPLEELGDLVRGSAGKIVGVTFVKRTDGRVRFMTCRLGVTKHLNGGVWANGNAGHPSDHGLVVVFDMGKQAYRSIPLENIVQVDADGQSFCLS